MVNQSLAADGEESDVSPQIPQVLFNQDIKLPRYTPTLKRNEKMPKPGDSAKVLAWPWENEGNVSVLVGRYQQRHTLDVSPNICEIVELIAGSKTWAGTRHGPLLEHVLADNRAGVGCSKLTLMFRAHYGEHPIELPVPDDGCEVEYELRYVPQEDGWCEPIVIDGAASTVEEQQLSGSGGEEQKPQRFPTNGSSRCVCM